MSCAPPHAACAIQVHVTLGYVAHGYEAHLASMWSIWAPMDKLDCSTTLNTRKVLTCSAPDTTGPSGLMLDLCRLLVITSSLVLSWFKRRLFLAAHADILANSAVAVAI